MRKLIQRSLWFFGLALTLAAANAEQRERQGSNGADPLKVLVSIRPLALLVEDLAGPWVEVDTLISPQADPHNYSLRVSDMRKLAEADLVVWLGPEMERFLSKPVERLPENNKLALTLLSGLVWPQDGHELHHKHHHGRDPHIWLNPEATLVVLDALAAKMGLLKPEVADALQSRRDHLRDQIMQYHTDTKRQFSSLKGVGFGVHHDAYGHFVAAYDLNQLAHVNILPEERLGVRQMGRLRQQLQSAQCLLTERDGAEPRRLAELWQLPLVVADPLAADLGVNSYLEFMESLRDSFLRCLASGGS